MTPDQKVALSVAPTDSFGNPAKVETVAWSSSNEEVLTLVVAEDGMSVEAVTTGVTGVAQVVVKADADLGEGVKELVGTLDVEVVPGEAVNLNLVAGTPGPR